jgi:hypothetical protein
MLIWKDERGTRTRPGVKGTPARPAGAPRVDSCRTSPLRAPANGLTSDRDLPAQGQGLLTQVRTGAVSVEASAGSVPMRFSLFSQDPAFLARDCLKALGSKAPRVRS